MSDERFRWWREICAACGRTWALTDRRWCCACGGLLDLTGPLADPTAVATGPLLARYGPALPPGATAVDLGMVVTPLAEPRPGELVKADYEHPTGSFKDRGAAAMVGVAHLLGVESLVVDSSGNAGRATAAHAAAAGIPCRVYLPEGTNPAKVSAIAGYGAEVVTVAGGRQAVAAAAQGAAGSGPGSPWYASHVHQPSFHHGVKTLAFELYEQMGATDAARATVVVPAGNGTLVLGLWLGFGELVALGRLTRRPALVAVQAAGCAPLAGLVSPSPSVGTVAAGIAIPAPPRAAQVRAAVVASGGAVVTVTDDEILAGRDELADLGFAVEPTGAVAWAGRRRATVRPGPVVAVLTGR